MERRSDASKAGTIRVVQSSSAARRLESAAAFVRGFPPGTELLLVSATREAVDDFVRQLPGEATFGLHRFTLAGLAARLAEPVLAAESIAPCTLLGGEALATRAVHAALAGGQLPYFEPVARLPGFPVSLAATIAELRSAGVAADLLAARPDPAPELGVLLAQYEARMAEANLADRAALFMAAARLVSEGRVSAWVGLPLLLFDASVESAVERGLVAVLAATARSVLATVPAGDERTLASLGALAPVEQLPENEERTSLGRLRRYLFSVEQPPRGAADGQVRFFSAPGEGREAVEVTRAILDEARAGVPFDEVAVFLRVPEASSSLVQTALRRAGIPAYFARGTKRPDPSGRAFLALLACKTEGLSARRFAEYLSFGQVPGGEGSGAPHEQGEGWSSPQDELLGAAASPARPSAEPSKDSGSTALAWPSPVIPADAEIQAQLGSRFRGNDTIYGPVDVDDSPTAPGGFRAPWKWEHLLVDAAVIGGADRWRRRLDGLANELLVRRTELAAEEPESPRLAGIERDLAHLDGFRDFALPVIEELAGFPAAASWGEWIARLGGLAARVLRRPERVLRLLQELQPMADVGPVSLDEARAVLNDRLAFLEEDPPARRYGRVFVATPSEARGRTFRVVFVLGLAERVFPQRPREDPLLLDRLRAEVSGELATQEDRGRHERLLLRLAVGAARERLYLSYPRLDVIQARPRVTSFYGLDVARALHGSIPDFERFERDAAALAGARLAWPAPADPGRAIDPIEHDLAMLWGLLREPDKEESAGRAQYLIELNACLGRSLRARFARWERRNWLPSDGLVRKTAAVEAALAPERLGARPYSPSALEKFAVCPYRFFLSAIHRLEPRGEAAALERLDPLTRGSLFHRVQAESLRALEREGLLPVAEADLPRAQDVLLAVLEQVAAELEEKLAPAIGRVWRDEIAAIRTDLLAWLRHLAADGKRWRPYRVELGFGLPSDPALDPASFAEPVVLDGGAKLRGAVDLVERSAAGTGLRVTDHKTGADRTAKGLVVGGGETLQPVLYGLAVEAALRETVREARLFFCTWRGGFAERVVPLDERARAAGREALAVIDRSIAAGVLPPAPREGTCKLCEFRVVCGPWEEERLKKKDPRLLVDLLALRERP
jgi:ATP-dependent helicase/nuclease subunit B